MKVMIFSIQKSVKVPKKCIQEVAQYNASLMLKDGRMSHDAGGTTMRERSLKFYCYDFPQSENVAVMSNEKELKTAILTFINSPAHRNNMMNQNNLYVGFAVARNERSAFVSMNFIQKRNINSWF